MKHLNQKELLQLQAFSRFWTTNSRKVVDKYLGKFDDREVAKIIRKLLKGKKKV